MHLLNYTEECVGTYTFESPNGHSAIDHIITNDTLIGKYLGMYIDEESSESLVQNKPWTQESKVE